MITNEFILKNIKLANKAFLLCDDFDIVQDFYKEQIYAFFLSYDIPFCDISLSDKKAVKEALEKTRNMYKLIFKFKDNNILTKSMYKENYSRKVADLINHVILTTDKYGNDCSMEEKLEEIKSYIGNGEIYNEIKELVEFYNMSLNCSMENLSISIVNSERITETENIIFRLTAKINEDLYKRLITLFINSRLNSEEEFKKAVEGFCRRNNMEFEHIYFEKFKSENEFAKATTKEILEISKIPLNNKLLERFYDFKNNFISYDSNIFYLSPNDIKENAFVLTYRTPGIIKHYAINSNWKNEITENIFNYDECEIIDNNINYVNNIHEVNNKRTPHILSNYTYTILVEAMIKDTAEKVFSNHLL